MSISLAVAANKSSDSVKNKPVDSNTSVSARMCIYNWQANGIVSSVPISHSCV